MPPVADVLQEQRRFFREGYTRPVPFRTAQLRRLREAVRKNESRIFDALRSDLSKTAHESYMTEVGIVLDEIRHAIRHIGSWARPRRVRTPLVHFPAASRIYPEPYGVSLIIAPWNYPFQLAVAPLIGAIAAGNCAVLKPSELAPATSAVLLEMMENHFDRRFIAVVEGDVQTSRALLNEKFDYIFFTGSVPVGKKVMEAAAGHLTPVTLELGGKSPCIVDRDADIELSSRRIASGKFMNAGQTCIAPDYLMVHESVRASLLEGLKSAVKDFFGDDPAVSPDYPRIINDKHFQRLTGLMQQGKIVLGGRTDSEQRYIAPTLIESVSWGDPIMQEEIFGPLLPVLTYKDLAEVIEAVNERPRPLALYFFSRDTGKQQEISRQISFGSGCFNDTLLQVANPYLPFGGVGSSGIGAYHGKYSFETFSHRKSVMRKPFLPDIPLRYPPFGNKLRILRKILK